MNEKTTRKYLNIIRDIVDKTMQDEYKQMEGKLGGEGKIIEIDEMIATKRKFNRGRVPPKQHVLIFGMTQRDGGPVRVEDGELYNYLWQKDRFREGLEIDAEAPGLRPPQERRRPDDAQREQPEDGSVVIDEDTRVIFVDDDEEEGTEEDVCDVDEVVDGERTGQFRFRRDMEARERALFGTQGTASPKKTVLFHVPDRKAATLVPIIERFVKPNSFVFSDKWAGYVSLNGTFHHFIVVHNKRFVKYHFDGRDVVKITTNHIERVWVDVRKAIRGVAIEDVNRRIQEVPYRRLKLENKTHRERVGAVVEDIVRLHKKSSTVAEDEEETN